MTSEKKKSTEKKPTKLTWSRSTHDVHSICPFVLFGSDCWGMKGLKRVFDPNFKSTDLWSYKPAPPKNKLQTV